MKESFTVSSGKAGNDKIARLSRSSFYLVYFAGGLIVDTWFHHIDIIAAAWTIIYTGISVSSAYAESTLTLYLLYLAQGAFETCLQIGKP